MTLDNLRTPQKELLKTLVAFIEAGQLSEPIAPMPITTPTHQFVVYLHGRDSFRFKHISDLDALCDAGLLSFRWNRFGTGKLYYVTAAGYTAVANNFTTDLTALPAGAQDFNIHDILRAMSGGMVGVNDIGDHVELSQIVADPVLRPQVVETLVGYLRETLRAELPRAGFLVADRSLRALHDQLLRPRPDAARVEQLGRELSLTGETAVGAASPRLQTILKVWTYLYPLLLIGAARTESPSRRSDP